MSAGPGPRSYRPDIDGLRAVAVLAVIVYHAFPDLLPGGYVGVDVFFAISGFLIGGLLIEEAEKTGRIRPLAFYQRRALRILPALLTVLLACSGAALYFLPADGIRAVGKHVAAAAAFVSNFALWRESGYFDQGATHKPLLHLWSLAVEEQFYLVAPLALWALVRTTRRVSLGVLLLSAASFAVCFTRTDPTAAFFEPQSRFWEIGAGVWVAALVRARPALGDRGRRVEAGSWLGLLLVVVTCLRFRGGGALPVAANAVPLAGACLLLGSRGSWLNRRVLGHRYAVFLGKISYPLYLWHWPLLSFHTIVQMEPPPPREAATLLGVALLLSVATWRWIETPLREAREGKARRRNALALTTGLGILGFVALGVSLHGAPAAGSVAATDLASLQWPDADPACMAALGLDRLVGAHARDAIFCGMSGAPDEIDALVLGDSSANSFYPGLADALGKRGLQVANIGLGSCAPVRGARGRRFWNERCEAFNERSFAFALSHPRVRWVLLGFTEWDFQNMDFDGVPDQAPPRARFDEESRRLLADVAELRRAGKTVVVSFDVPDIGDGVDWCRDARSKAADPADAGAACLHASSQEPSRLVALEWWRQAFVGQDVCVFRQMGVLENAQGEVVLADAHGLVFRDGHHPTRYGSSLLASALERSPCAPGDVPQ